MEKTNAQKIQIYYKENKKLLLKNYFWGWTSGLFFGHILHSDRNLSDPRTLHHYRVERMWLTASLVQHARRYTSDKPLHLWRPVWKSTKQLFDMLRLSSQQLLSMFGKGVTKWILNKQRYWLRSQTVTNVACWNLVYTETTHTEQRGWVSCTSL